MEGQKKVDVIFYTIAYSATVEDVERMKLNDPILSQVVEQYTKELDELGVEVFKVDNNIIYTEKGYVVVVLKELVERLEEYKQMMYN